MNRRKINFKNPLWPALMVVFLPVCAAAQTTAAQQDQVVHINQIQIIGTHNSYHAGLTPGEAKVLAEKVPQLFTWIDYKHPSLTAQMDAGVRQLEIDVFADSKGGRYAHPAIDKVVAEEGLIGDAPYDPNGVMNHPGFKVMHVEDVDQRSNCEPFVACLEEVRRWSHAHPGHVPLFLLIETKEGDRTTGGFNMGFPITRPEDFTPQVWDELDAAIRSVFHAEELITPDDVRGKYPTLNQAIRNQGWPTLASARGKVVFLLDQHVATQAYLQGHPGLRGRVIFTNSSPGDPDAAFLEVNDPDVTKISALVKQGYLIRTRTDANTVQARTNDTSDRETAFRSGAQILSTDYPASEPAPWADDKGRHYYVAFPHHEVARCNPVLKLAGCVDAFLEPQDTSRSR